MSKKNEIIFHQIRNCTTKLTYNGVNILIDPFLVPKGFYPGLDIAPTPEQKKIRVPMNDLPISINEILKGGVLTNANMLSSVTDNAKILRLKELIESHHGENHGEDFSEIIDCINSLFTAKI